MIILFGLAGSGKGTQGKALSEIFGWKWLSTGEVIRQHGGYAELINGGGLIPDEDVTRMMSEYIRKTEEEGFDVILDGYPRSEAQAHYIADNMADKIDGAIILEVPKDELVERLMLRGRDDDKEKDSIMRRFAIFEENIAKILAILGEKGIQVERVDGVGTVEEVTERLVKVVEELNPDAIEQENDVNGGEIEKSYGE